MKKHKKLLSSFLALSTLFAGIRLSSDGISSHIVQAATEDNIQSFETGVPSNWTSSTGTLSTSTKHFKHNQNSLLWQWGNNDKITVTAEKNMLAASKSKTGGIIAWIYNEEPIDDKITLNFGTTAQILENNPLYTFDFHLNYKGWRALWVNFKNEGVNPNFEGKRVGDIEQMEIIAPKTKQSGELYIDLLEFVKSIYWCRSQDYQVPLQRSADVKGDIWQRNYYYINQTPYLPLEEGTETQWQAFDTIVQRLNSWFYGTDKYNDTSQMNTRKNAFNSFVSSGVKKYNNLNITRNADGTITGKPLFGQSSPYKKTGETFGRGVAEPIFLPLALDYKVNKNQASLTKIMNLFDYYNDQGWAEGSGLGSLNHESNRSTGYFTAVYLMKDELKQTGRLERERNAVNWYSNFGKTFVHPSVDYEASTADELRTQALNRLIYVLLLDNSPKKIQAMNSYVAWLDGALQVNPNLADTIKPDFMGFHHQAPYMSNYPPHSYHLTSMINYLLHDTVFELSGTSQNNLKQALITHDILSNETEIPLPLRGRFPDSNPIAIEILPSYAYMAMSGNPETGEAFDEEMAGIFIKNWNIDENLLKTELLNMASIKISYLHSLGSIDTMLDVLNSGVKASSEQQGFWAKPYGGLGVQRKDNWMSMVKGFSKYLWDFEASDTENIYGRYMSYGTLQILAQGDPITDKANGYDYQNGWDWNRMPGATTKYLPLLQLSSTNLNGANQNHSDQTFLGSVSSKGEEGVWAMSMHDTTYDNSFYAKKSVFFFDNEIIMLGSNITNNDTNNPTETTLFQSNLNGNTTKPIYVNSTDAVVQYPYHNTLTSSNSAWLMDPYGNGYYIPDASKVQIKREKQLSRDSSDKKQTVGEYATAWINHGTSPQDEGYEYVIKIQTTPQEMATYAKQTNYQVLQKDQDAHIVKNNTSQAIGYAIFVTNKLLTNQDYIRKTDTPVLAMVKEDATKNNITLSVSDPDLRVSNTDNMVSSQMKKARVELTGKWSINGNTTDARIVGGSETTTIIEYDFINGKTIELSLNRLS